LASGRSRFSVEMVVVSMPVTHENVPAKVTTGLPSYGNYPYDRCLFWFTMKRATLLRRASTRASSKSGERGETKSRHGVKRDG
jgi:hypothetical protein